MPDNREPFPNLTRIERQLAFARELRALLPADAVDPDFACVLLAALTVYQGMKD